MLGFKQGYPIGNPVEPRCEPGFPSRPLLRDLVANPNDALNGFFCSEDKLQIVLSQQYSGVPDKYVLYYGLAVVKKETTFNFKQLKGKDSCHTGVGRTVGWNIPVGYLLYTKEMPLHKDQYKSAADFFGKSCAPGEVIEFSIDLIYINEININGKQSIKIHSSVEVKRNFGLQRPLKPCKTCVSTLSQSNFVLLDLIVFSSLLLLLC